MIENQAVILHSIPARLRPPGIPFRMTAWFKPFVTNFPFGHADVCEAPLLPR
jgi:hypothetical protein